MKEKWAAVSDRLKQHRKKAVAAAAVLASVALLVGFAGPGMGGGGARTSGSGSGSGAVRTVTLERGDLASSVSATGTVYSSNTTEVYSNLNYPVKAVHVEVGDRVSAGDVLAELNTAALEQDIEKQTAALSKSQNNAYQQVQTAQRDLTNAQAALSEERNTELLNAEAAVRSAEAAVRSAEASMDSAALDVIDARSSLNDSRDMDDADDIVQEHRNTLNKTEIDYENKKAQLADKKRELEDAKAKLEAAEISVQEQIQKYQDSLKGAQISADLTGDRLTLEKLRADLEDCVVTAPVDGTVTAVNAVEGGSGSGLLFVIQNTDALKVVTNIKEYDIASVREGDKVIITSDATGDQEFVGALSRIAPTSTETASGGAAGSTDAEFASEVTVTMGGENLRIGMNTRLNIVTEEKSGVYSVPYEAVMAEADGSSYIYVQEGEGVRRVDVETGLETNLYIEISGDGLRDGMQVVKNPDSVDAGQVSGGGRPADNGSGDRPGQGEAPGGGETDGGAEAAAQTADREAGEQ